jgi:hypothetical protein
MKVYVYPDRTRRWQWESSPTDGSDPETSTETHPNVELAMDDARSRVGPTGVSFIVGKPQ